jgi:hypothetical protein
MLLLIAPLANRPHTCSGAAATAAAEFIKKKNRRSGPTLGQDSPKAHKEDARDRTVARPKCSASKC